MQITEKKKLVGIGLFVVLMGLAAFAWLAINPMGVEAGNNNGNGSPTGKHFSLKLHGVPDGQAGEGLSEDDVANGGNIWIPLDGKCDIGLMEGPFAVTDRSCGFDGDRAEFMLPKPVDDEFDTSLNYSVWVRVTATKNPNSSIDMTTCFSDDVGGDGPNSGTFCNTGTEFTVSETKNKRFKDVSKALLTVCVDEGDGETVDLKSHGLFEDDFEDYFWHVDNNGVRLLQMRFYPVGTDPVGETCTRGGHNKHGASSKK